jgi:hypothetical protein
MNETTRWISIKTRISEIAGIVIERLMEKKPPPAIRVFKLLLHILRKACDSDKTASERVSQATTDVRVRAIRH